MNKKFLGIAILSSAVVLTGCSINIDPSSEHYSNSNDMTRSEQENRQSISTLMTGMTVGQVIAKMGVAEFNEMSKVNDVNKQVLYYRTQRTKADGFTTKDECTPLVFVDNVLVGWGNQAL